MAYLRVPFYIYPANLADVSDDVGEDIIVFADIDQEIPFAQMAAFIYTMVQRGELDDWMVRGRSIVEEAA